jgi:hypothetical protein
MNGTLNDGVKKALMKGSDRSPCRKTVGDLHTICSFLMQLKTSPFSGPFMRDTVNDYAFHASLYSKVYGLYVSVRVKGSLKADDRIPPKV